MLIVNLWTNGKSCDISSIARYRGGKVCLSVIHGFVRKDSEVKSCFAEVGYIVKASGWHAKLVIASTQINEVTSSCEG